MIFYFLSLSVACYIDCSLASERALQKNDLPDAPPETLDFSLEKFEALSNKESDLRNRWDNYQAEMNSAFVQTIEFQELNKSELAGRLAWKEFTKVFSADNPYSEIDNLILRVIGDADISGSNEAISEILSAINAHDKATSTGVNQSSSVKLVDEVQPSQIKKLLKLPFHKATDKEGTAVRQAKTNFNEKKSRLGPAVLESSEVYLLGDESCVYTLDRCRLKSNSREFSFVYEQVLAEVNLLQFVSPIGKEDMSSQTVEILDGSSLLRMVLTSNEDYEGTVMGLYPSKQKALEGNVKKGRLEGGVQYFYDSGQLAAQMEFKQGIPDGSYREWYKTGKLKADTDYRKGLLSGKFETWYESGKPEIRAKANDQGRLEGNLKEWYPDGSIRVSGKFTNGYPSGRYREWYSTGALALDYKPRINLVLSSLYPDSYMSHIVASEKGASSDISISDTRRDVVKNRFQLQGNVTKYGSHFFQNGEKRIEMKNAKIRIWSEERALLLERSPTSEAVYFSNGSPRTIKKWTVRGLETGAWSRFDLNGQVREIINYDEGKRHGPIRTFREDGVVYSEGFFVEGMKHGAFTTYALSGAPLASYCYDYNQKVDLSFCESD
ncbi:hypothetical protein N9H56_03775 [Pseudomonadales bacterium]|nr:hypothetical protein [Pseudomonadales bacterium]